MPTKSFHADAASSLDHGYLALDRSHDPSRRSFVDSANGHRNFPIQNLPIGVFTRGDGEARAGVAIGDQLLDLKALARSPFVPGDLRRAMEIASAAPLNAFFAMGSATRRAVRLLLSDLLEEHSQHQSEICRMLLSAADVTMELPFAVGDFSDFYAGIEHARNVGQILRPDNPLLPNYKYVPIAYHGRASTIMPSGRPITRPVGQVEVDNGIPHFAPTRRLDYELELGAWIANGNQIGQSIPIETAADRIGGFCLLNDWSARDVQAWEYQPLGPFLAKSFASTISPWVVTSEALAPFRAPHTARANSDPAPLPYLLSDEDQASGALDIELAVYLSTPKMREAGDAPIEVATASSRFLYWTFAQMVAHQTSNGCNVRPGDLIGSGTISGSSPGSYGSLMEITRGGREPMQLPDGEVRAFLDDGDEVIMQAWTRGTKERVGIGFGECRAIVLPVGSAA
jgi:fumarylacetoacetase